MPMYIPIIGMEIHLELKTKSKMFCSCPNCPDTREPNIAICEICLAHPGTLPTPNREAIVLAVTIGQALGCQIRDQSTFDRKHYFYPDLPKGYQISQYDEPIAEHGRIDLFFPIDTNIRDTATIGIRRVHLEEDTAKLLHDTDGSTLVDFNRAGVPLVEIVTDPDFKTALEAKTYCQELRTLFRALQVSDADMEKGHLRCEANISVQEAGRFEIVAGVVKSLGDYILNPKVELKNLNSFKAVERGIQFEIDRQIALLKTGASWQQQTRGWDEDRGETVLQRVKENAEDYRYFPEPDIPPFHPKLIAGEIILPELPQAKRARFHEEYGFSYADAKLFGDNDAWAGWAEAVMTELYDWLNNLPETKTDSTVIKTNKKNNLARLAGGWMTSKLMGLLNEKNMEISQVSFSAENFAELIALIYKERVSTANAVKILTIMVASDRDHDPTHLMEEKGWGQITDEAILGAAVLQVIKSHPDQVAAFQKGKESVLQFLIGMVMKTTEGGADPRVVERLLRALL